MLHFHQQEIINFFENYMPKPNLKLQSVLADARCTNVDNLMTAVGLLFYTVADLYWKLVRSNTHYLDFHKYVGRMRECFAMWSTDASPLLDVDQPPMFDKFPIQNDEVFQSLVSLPEERKSIVKNVLEKLVTGMLQVLDRQLSDFTEGGRYTNIQDQEKRDRMNHCKLTNLIGEQCFGDLSFKKKLVPVTDGTA